MAKPKRPRDINQLAKLIVDISTGESAHDLEHKDRESKKNTVLSDAGRKGGIKGGKVRAEKLSAKKRTEIAVKAAKARWEKNEGEVKERKKK